MFLAGTAELCRFSPPKAVVYLKGISATFPFSLIVILLILRVYA
jgi:hypothetical protein